MLKLITILLVVSAAVAYDFHEIETACLEESGYTIENFNNYKKTLIYDPDDHAFKCFMKCMLFKTSVIQADGSFDAATAVDNQLVSGDDLSPDDRKEKIAQLSQCDNSHVEGDACDKGFFIAECLLVIRKHANETGTPL